MMKVVVFFFYSFVSIDSVMNIKPRETFFAVGSALLANGRLSCSLLVKSNLCY